MLLKVQHFAFLLVVSLIKGESIDGGGFNGGVDLMRRSWQLRISGDFPASSPANP